jgi:hypothetical protein
MCITARSSAPADSRFKRGFVRTIGCPDRIAQARQRVEGVAGAPPRTEASVPAEVELPPGVRARGEGEQGLVPAPSDADRRIEEREGAARGDAKLDIS